MEDQPKISTLNTRPELSNQRDMLVQPTTMQWISETLGAISMVPTVQTTNSSNSEKENSSTVGQVDILMLILRMLKENM